MFSRWRARPFPRAARLGQRQAASRPSWIRSRHLSGGQHGQKQTGWPEHPVRLLGPIAWSVTAVGIIYSSCAAYDVYQDASKYSAARRQTLTYEQIEADKAPRRLRDSYFAARAEHTKGPIVVASPLDVWTSLSGPGQVFASVVAVNTLTLGLSHVPSPHAQRFVSRLWHVPVHGEFRYHQLLTSAFAHTGPLHLGCNMMVMFNFASSLARTPDFANSGSHTLAFYLSSAIVSALAHHIATTFSPDKMSRYRPALGFSGVAMAVFAAWCMKHPEGRVQVLFVPWDFTALGMLEGLTVFEVVGLLGLFRRAPIQLAHGAHLGGLLFGAAYVTHGKGQKYWKSFRRAAFRTGKLVGAI